MRIGTEQLKLGAKELKDKVDALYRDMVELNAGILEVLAEGAPTSDHPDLADTGYLLREMSLTLKEMKTDCKAKSDFIGKVLFVAIARDHLSGKSGEMVARGEYGSAFPRPSKKPVTPKRGSPEYVRLLQWLGVPAEAAALDVLTFHYVRLSELINDRLREGIEPPTDVGVKLASDDSCTYVKKKN